MARAAGKNGGFISEPKTNLAPSLVVHKGKLLAHAPWEHSDHNKLFGQQPGSSEQHTGSPAKKKKKNNNNKGKVVSPYSPDCGLSPTNPGRDGLKKSKAILAFSPFGSGEKSERVD